MVLEPMEKRNVENLVAVHDEVDKKGKLNPTVVACFR